jgi:hypothetical protein
MYRHNSELIPLQQEQKQLQLLIWHVSKSLAQYSDTVTEWTTGVRFPTVQSF